MRYLLATMHKTPMYYAIDGSSLSVEIEYVPVKHFKEINADGTLVSRKIEGASPTCQGIWMVKSQDQAIEMLEEKNVFPFSSKEAAKQFALRHNISSFKYIAIT